MSYIFDTNVLIDGVDIDKFSKDKIYIPICVLEELDSLKNTKKSYSARKAIRWIKNKIGDGIITVVTECDNDYSYESFDFTINDNKILKYCKYINTKIDNKSELITKDLAMSIKAKSMNIPCVLLENENSNIYKGYIEITGNSNDICRFFENINSVFLYPNEYVIINNTSTNETSEMRWDGEKLVNLVLPEQNIIKAKNSLQRCALDLLNNKHIGCAAIMGGVGSGKTFLSTQMASYFVLDKRKYKKILGIREPHGEGKDIGYLKGTFEDKTSRFFKPIEQQMKGQGEYNYLIQSGIIETEIPYYMKGTTYDDTIFVVDEAEDLTEAQIRLIGTRVGENSRIFFSGDFTQSVKDKGLTNPLVKMCEILKGNENFGCIYLDEDVRSDISKMFANIFK